MTKISVVILSNPNDGEEALGRLFNALVFANDLSTKNQDVLVFFQGTATRWIKALEDASHPAHGLYKMIKPKIKGVSKACAAVFGAEVDVEQTSINMLAEYDIPGIGGATSLANYLIEGYMPITF